MGYMTQMKCDIKPGLSTLKRKEPCRETNADGGVDHVAGVGGWGHDTRKPLSPAPSPPLLLPSLSGIFSSSLVSSLSGNNASLPAFLANLEVH